MCRHANITYFLDRDVNTGYLYRHVCPNHIPQQAGGHYLLGEKLRDDQEDHQEALSRRGRYQKVKDNLEVKEVVVGKGECRRRFVLVYNPEEAKKDRATRKLALQKIKEALLALGDQRGKAHKKAVCALLAHRTLGRYLRQLKNGALRIDRKKVKTEAHLAGKYLLSTSDDSLSPEADLGPYPGRYGADASWRI
jgi:hypothetical protein